MKDHAGICERRIHPRKGFGKVGLKMTIGAVGSRSPFYLGPFGDGAAYAREFTSLFRYG